MAGKDRKQKNYPRRFGLRRQERCRKCGEWTPIGSAENKNDVLCAICM